MLYEKKSKQKNEHCSQGKVLYMCISNVYGASAPESWPKYFLRHFLHKNLFLKIDPKKLVDTLMLVDTQTLVLPEGCSVFTFSLHFYSFKLWVKNEPKN